VPQPPYILAHDLGTTGNKVTLFEAASGTPIASTTLSYPTRYPYPNWAEQDPADWQQAVLGGTRRLLSEAAVEPGAIAAVSFSGHMQGAVLVDRAGLPLRPAIIWADQRATPQAELICRSCGEASMYQLTGHRVSAAYTAAKVLWVRDNQPDIYRRTHKVLQAKDYAAFLLTGVMATDYSDASGTQLYDLVGRRWAVDVLQTLGLAPQLMPDAYPSSAVIGGVTPQAAAATGLLAGTPVVIGGGDGACATVGAGSVREGDTYAYIGSSAWIALTTGRPIFDPRQRTFNYAHLDPALYFPIGTMQSAGGAYDWLEQLWHGQGEGAPLHQVMDAQAAAVPAGASGIFFLPYLLGERSPHWNPLARAAFVGLAMPHGRAELTRAVLEGVALNLRWILDALRAQGVQVGALRLIGGGARSALWRQILADVFDLPILRPALSAEATSLGAAIAGGVGVGLYPDFGVADRLIPAAEAEQPNPSDAQRYAALYPLFQQTYAALEPIFRQLATLTHM
jgi:xylulokinase